MLSSRTRKIAEDALGRTLDADEEAGYPSLAELSPEVIATARRLREASNAVTASVYLQHVVPSATLDEVRRFME